MARTGGALPSPPPCAKVSEVFMKNNQDFTVLGYFFPASSSAGCSWPRRQASSGYRLFAAEVVEPVEPEILEPPYMLSRTPQQAIIQFSSD